MFHFRNGTNELKPETPEVGKIYSGKVSNTVNFGCFVQIEGLRRRCEGLVHISQLREIGRVTNVTDVVSRGMKVYVRASYFHFFFPNLTIVFTNCCLYKLLFGFQVKVISIAGQKISLSMKDVNQETGSDLNPASHMFRKNNDRWAIFLFKYYYYYYYAVN